jgi:hypothetical protein
MTLSQIDLRIWPLARVFPWMEDLPDATDLRPREAEKGLFAH